MPEVHTWIIRAGMRRRYGERLGLRETQSAGTDGAAMCLILGPVTRIPGM